MKVCEEIFAVLLAVVFLSQESEGAPDRSLTELKRLLGLLEGEHDTIADNEFLRQTASSNQYQCQSNPCVKGICHEQCGGFSCTCVPGWTGKTCDKYLGVIFRGTVGIGTQFNTGEAWKAAGPGTTTEIECVNVQRDGCKKHYRHPLIDDWTSLNPQKLRYSIYKNNVEVVWVLFNAKGSTKTNWFHQSRVLASSYTDLTPTASYNAFAIDNPSFVLVDRDFYVNQDFGGCGNDNTWFGTFDNTGNCFFDQYGKWPYIMYSKLRTKANTGKIADFEFGDCSIVTVVE